MPVTLTRRPATWATALFLLITLVGLASLDATHANSTVPKAKTAKPTIVLIHGAFADGSSWNGVAARLQQKGYTVITPGLPMRGLHSDTSYVKSILDTINGPVVLVGHSYGGAVISNVASHDSDVRALVVVAGFLPAVGESVSDTNALSTDKLLGPDQLDARPYPLAGGGTGMDLYIKPDDFRRVAAADLPKSTTRLLAASQRPIQASAFDEPLTSAGWTTIPTWCLVATHDRAVGVDAEREMAERAQCHTVETSGSHLVMISKPGIVAKLILSAVTATNP